MTNTQLIKKAYVRGLAARGILRRYTLLKKADDEAQSSTPLNNPVLNGANAAAQGALNTAHKTDGLSDYAVYGLTGAGIGSAIGALIQAARKKNILAGLGVGAGIGGATGLGAKATLNILHDTGVLSNDNIDAAMAYTDRGMTNADSFLTSNEDDIKRIATLAGIGALSGSALGAAIQAARKKSIGLGAGVGAGIGGAAGLAAGLAPNIIDWSKAGKNKLAQTLFGVQKWDDLSPEQQEQARQAVKLGNGQPVAF